MLFLMGISSLIICFGTVAMPYMIGQFIDALIDNPHGTTWRHYGWAVVFSILFTQMLAYRLRVWAIWQKYFTIDPSTAARDIV